MNTINIPVEVYLPERHNRTGFFAYAKGVEDVSGHYSTAAAARRGLRKQLLEAWREMLKTCSNKRRWIVGTTTGDVLLVSWRHGAWGYDISGPARVGASSCHGRDTFEDCLADAQRHAEQCFDGIAWQHSL